MTEQNKAVGGAGHGVAIASVRVAVAMIEFKGQLDERLYRRALRLQMGSRGVGFAVMMIVCGLCVAFTGEPPASLVAPLVGFLVGGVILFNPYLVARRGMKTGAMVSAPFHGSADEAYFVVETQYGRSEIPWSKFFRVRTGRDLLLLYTSAHGFHILARSFFASDADWESFRTLATTKVKVLKPRTIWKTIGLWFLIIIGVFVIWLFFQR